MLVYELLHTYYIYEGVPYYSYKRLGYYSSLENLTNAISSYSKLPGFCDAPNGFIVKQREVLGISSNICFYQASIYAHTKDFEDYEHEVELGLFYDKNAAQNAIELFCTNNALFLNNPLLVIERLVEKYTINEHCGWVDGFTVDVIQ